MMTLLLLPVALLLDLLIGDPRWLPHPVRALGAWYAVVEQWLYRDSYGWGIAAWLAVVTPALLLFGGGVWLAGLWEPWAGWSLATLAVWLAIAARDLADHAWRVHRPLLCGDLPAARQSVSMIVGRDTAELDQPEIARAAIEAVAESTVDGVVAPLLWASVGLAVAGPAGGAVGAWLFRAANTLDSAWGHRTERLQRFGWLSARADDALAFVPARLTAALMVLLGGHPKRTLHVWWRDAHRHASPNAGRAEAAMAGALDVRLGGCNIYDGERHEGPIFHSEGHEPTANDLALSVRLMLNVTISSTLFLTLVLTILLQGSLP
jgi:adenosylcobinamide-phosphate synthase